MIKRQDIVMGMPINVCIDINDEVLLDKSFEIFKEVDKKFSTYKEDSETIAIQKGNIKLENVSEEMSEIIKQGIILKEKTLGYFDMYYDEVFDPTGIVKGWAIDNVSSMLKEHVRNFFVDAGGDIYAAGTNETGNKWRVGIQDPFDTGKIFLRVNISNMSIATSGNYQRGKHIKNPSNGKEADEVSSVSIVAPSATIADGYATAVFAKGENGLDLIKNDKEVDGCIILKDKRVITTPGFRQYLIQ